MVFAIGHRGPAFAGLLTADNEFVQLQQCPESRFTGPVVSYNALSLCSQGPSSLIASPNPAGPFRLTALSPDFRVVNHHIALNQ